MPILAETQSLTSMKIKTIAAIAFFLLPTVAFAQVSGSYWTPIAGVLNTTVASYGLKVPGISGGTGCLGRDAVGLITSSGSPCGGGSGTVGSGTQGQVPFYNANGTALTATSSLFLNQSGNVGIGTSSPVSQLNVQSSSEAVEVLSNPNGGTSQSWNFSVGGGGQFAAGRFAINPSTSATKAAGGLQLSASTLFLGTAANAIITPTNGDIPLQFRGNQTPTTSGTLVSLGTNNQGNLTAISGIQTATRIDQNFSPTSGTAVYNAFDVSPTINQTGGANGVTRSIYVNPILTAAANFRGIELANASGYGAYQSGASALNYFAGNTGIGSTTPQAPLTLVAASSSVPVGVYTGLVSIIAGFENTTVKLFQTIDQWGHRVTGGDTPTISGGTSSVAGNDNNGTITVAGVLLTSVTLTFAHPWVTAPDCSMADSSTGITGAISSISTTQVVFAFSAGINSGTVWYQCVGHQ